MTERKTTEDLLRQSGDPVPLPCQNSSDMIRILDSEARIVSIPLDRCDPRYPKHKTSGRTPLSLVHPDDLDRVRVALGEVFARSNAGTPPTEFIQVRLTARSSGGKPFAKNKLDVPAVNGIVVTTRRLTAEGNGRRRFRHERGEVPEHICETTGTATRCYDRADATISLANSEFERLSGFYERRSRTGRSGRVCCGRRPQNRGAPRPAEENRRRQPYPYEFPLPVRIRRDPDIY
jgi:hypothetical protein